MTFDVKTQNKIIDVFLENQREIGQLSRALNNDVRGTVMYGSTVDAYTLNSITAGNYEGGELNVQELGSGKKTLTIDQAIYFAVNLRTLQVKNNEIEIPRSVLLEGNSSVLEIKERFLGELYLANAGSILGEQSDKILITKDNAYETIVKMHLKLKESSGKTTGVRYCFVSPGYAATLKLDPRLQKSFDQFEKDLLIEGTIGKIDGLYIVESTLLPAFTSILVDTRAGSFKDGYDETTITDMGTAGFGQLLKSLYVYGAKIWKPEYIVASHVVPEIDQAQVPNP